MAAAAAALDVLQQVLDTLAGVHRPVFTLKQTVFVLTYFSPQSLRLYFHSTWKMNLKDDETFLQGANQYLPSGLSTAVHVAAV
jgi:hypothetical protein